MVDKAEHDRFYYHYKVLRKFWNITKGYGANIKIHEDDDDKLTWDQWNTQENPWMRHRLYKTGEIPIADMKDMWVLFDKDENMSLSFMEVWEMWQEDNIFWHKFKHYFKKLDTIKKDTKLHEAEVEAFYEKHHPDEVAEHVAKFFGNYDTNGDGLIKTIEMWAEYRKELAVETHMAQIRQQFKNDWMRDEWYVMDTNRDGFVTYDELMAHPFS